MFAKLQSDFEALDSAWLILHAFDRLAKTVNNSSANDSQRRFIQFYATHNLAAFLEASENNAHLQQLAESEQLRFFWDALLSAPAVKQLIPSKDITPDFVQLRPQSSLSSYFLIKGWYCTRIAFAPRQHSGDGYPHRVNHFLSLALRYQAFPALVCRVNQFCQQLRAAVHSLQVIDLASINEALPSLIAVADKYGGAGLLVLARLNVGLAEYYSQVTNDAHAHYSELITGYQRFLTANKLFERESNDCHNALLGKLPARLLPNNFTSVAESIEFYKTRLLNAGLNEKALSVIYHRAMHAASVYASRYYIEEVMDSSALLSMQ